MVMTPKKKTPECDRIKPMTPKIHRTRSSSKASTQKSMVNGDDKIVKVIPCIRTSSKASVPECDRIKPITPKMFRTRASSKTYMNN